MTRFTLIAVCLAVALSAPASAQTYIEIRGGYAWPDDPGLSTTQLPGTSLGSNLQLNLNPGPVIAAAAGRDFDGPPRAELELSWRRNSLDGVSGTVIAGIDENGQHIIDSYAADPGGNISSTALLVNGYLDFNRAGWVRPFIGAGLGIAYVQADLGSFTSREWLPAGKVTAGLAWPITSGHEITLQGELFITDDLALAGGSIDNTSAAALIGYRRTF